MLRMAKQNRGMGVSMTYLASWVTVYFSSPWDVAMAIACTLSYMGTHAETMKVWRRGSDDRISYTYNYLAFLTLLTTSLEAEARQNELLSICSSVKGFAVWFFFGACVIN